MSLLEELKPTQRFSDRVKDYVSYRPSYPDALLDDLDIRIGGLKGAPVADVGSGTGILTRRLLARGAVVAAVEPNREMRQAAESALSQMPDFQSIDGTAEETHLSATSMRLVTSAQAFHWFEPVKTRAEFDRILKPKSLIALIWNERRTDLPFERAYDQIQAEFCGESFKKVQKVSTTLDATFKKFFHQGFETKFFDNFQELDREGLLGRFFSSSYSPEADSLLRTPAILALEKLFGRFQSSGRIRMEYKTELYVGL